MIFEFLIATVFTILQYTLGIFPSLPAMPQAIIDAGAWVIATVGSGAQVLSTIYSPPLFAAILTSIIVLVQFEQLYHLTMWIIRKIPISIH